MGLFSWLGQAASRSRVENLPDSIWLSKEAKLSGIAAEAMSASASERLTVVVAHFSDTLAKIHQVLNDSAMSHEFVESALSSTKLLDRKKKSNGPLILLTLADKLRVEESVADPGKHEVSFVVGERHPMRTKDDRINAFAEAVPVSCRVHFHSSLQDPVMKVFVGESIEKMLRGLGMNETDAITSNLVTSRLRSAQQKLAKAATGDEPAESPERWIQANCPGISLS